MNKSQSKYFIFFSKYFWFGVLAVLITIILQEKLDKNGEYYFIFNVGAILLSTIGLTVIVASLFTYALGTQEFIEYIENKLEDIIVGRNFLKNMDSEKKISALHSILKPNSLQEKIYKNLEEFYEYYINDIMNVSKKNIRSDYRISVDIQYDTDKSKLYAKGSVVYRLYPSEDGYEPITVGLSNDGLSKCTRLEIFDTHTKCETIDLEALEYVPQEHDNMSIASIDMKEYSIETHDHLSIELDFEEYGFDHWMAFRFLIFQATDGLNFTVNCFDDISIKEKAIYDLNSKYHISEDTNTTYRVSSHQWIQEGAGIVVIVSKPEVCSNCNTTRIDT